MALPSTVDLSTVDWRRDPTGWQSKPGSANLAAPRCPAVIACKQQSPFDPIWPCSGEHLHLSLDHSISVGSRILGNSLLVMSVSLCDILLIVSVLPLTDQPGMSRYENLLVAVMDPVTHVWDYFYNTKILPHIRFRTLGSSFVSIEQLCCLHPATTSERAKGRRGRAVPADLQFVSLVTKIQFGAHFTEPHQARPEFRSCFMDYRQQTLRKSHVSIPPSPPHVTSCYFRESIRNNAVSLWYRPAKGLVAFSCSLSSCTAKNSLERGEENGR